MRTAEEIIRWATECYRDRLALSTSLQKGSIVVLDMALRMQSALKVFTLDTGRLPEETYSMIEALRSRYGIVVELIAPRGEETERMTQLHGPNLFYRDRASRMLCCEIRKVRPLTGRLAGVDALLSGLRRDQSETRGEIQQVDESQKPVHVNPLAYWSKDEVDAYTALHQLPVHPLYAKGFTSIGCEPCTRATAVGEDVRAGRWWWEIEGGKECGIHFDAQGRMRRNIDVMINEVVGSNG